MVDMDTMSIPFFDFDPSSLTGTEWPLRHLHEAAYRLPKGISWFEN